MHITIIKGERSDRLEVRRPDGSEAIIDLPKKGPIPHDYVHFAVEKELGLKDAFWGKVAAGHDPAELAEMAKAGGHASASRLREPDAEIVEMVRAERLVECFEADLWSSGGSNAALREVAHAGWEQSRVAPLDVPDEAISSIRQSIADFAARWETLEQGQRVELEWAVA